MAAFDNQLQQPNNFSKLPIHSVFYIRNFEKASASGFLKKWPFEPQKFLKKEDI